MESLVATPNASVCLIKGFEAITQKCKKKEKPKVPSKMKLNKEIERWEDRRKRDRRRDEVSPKRLKDDAGKIESVNYSTMQNESGQ